MFIQSSRKVFFKDQNKTFTINALNEVIEAPDWIAQDALFRSLVRSGKIKVVVDVLTPVQTLVIPDPVIEPVIEETQQADPVVVDEPIAPVEVEETKVEEVEGPAAPPQTRRRSRRKKAEE